MIDDSIDPFDIIKPGIFDSPMRTYTVVVDEDMARLMLAHNREPVAGKRGTNRRASKVRIGIYKDTMDAGHWLLSPQPVVFSALDENGRTEMTDGQQRLKAFLEHCKSNPGATIELSVTVNAPPKVKLVLDTGKSKTAADFLRMAGEPAPVVLAPAIRALRCYNEIPFQSIAHWRMAGRMSVTAQDEYLTRFPELRGSVVRAMQMKSQAASYVLATVHYLMSQEYGPFVAEVFLRALEKGLVPGITATDARWRLREYLGRMAYEGYRWDGYEQLGLLLAAVNDFLWDSDKFDPKTVMRQMSATVPRFPRMVTSQDLPVDRQVALTQLGALAKAEAEQQQAE